MSVYGGHETSGGDVFKEFRRVHTPKKSGENDGKRVSHENVVALLRKITLESRRV